MGSGSPHTTDRLDRDGRRLAAPSAERNRGPIIEALRPILGETRGKVLEVGSGTGQHAAGLAAAFPRIDWQPSDLHEPYIDSIRAWAVRSGLVNIAEPIRLDAAGPWPETGSLSGVIAINVLHITPWQVTEGLVRGAATRLDRGAPLIVYGPFREGGRHTAESNAAFDAMLSAQDPAWGVRDIDDVAALAGPAGFGPPEVTPMPANNRLVCLRRR